MPETGFGFRPEELTRIQQEWQAVQRTMDGLTRRTGQIRDAIAKAVATDLTAGAVTGVVNFAAVSVRVAERVRTVHERADRLYAAKEQLTRELAEDVKKIATVIRQYQEAERRAHEGIGKAGGGHHGTPKSPGHPQGRHGTGGTGSPHPSGAAPGHGDDPAPTLSSAGAIGKNEVTFGGKGEWRSGESACREYIGRALDAMGITDPAAREAWTRGMLTVAERESGYNSPDWQVNKGPGDVNVTGRIQSDGAPLNCSRGGWQTTPETFAANHVQGTSTDIYDPVANAAASMQYVMQRYHVSPDGHDLAAKVQQADPHRPPHWY